MGKRKYTIEKTAGIILINQTLDKILMVKSKSGFWGFPKGHREKEDKNTKNETQNDKNDKNTNNNNNNNDKTDTN